jgi:hypothetical protein
LLVALLASACTLPADETRVEPTQDRASAEPGALDVSGVKDAAQTEVRRPSCAHHYSCCMDTRLGDEDDTPDHTRCYYCQSRCNDEGAWPSATYYGADCVYWRKQYEKGPPRGECQ